MKAEPESRLENGIDVAFSIDHLAAKTAPEPWDGKKHDPQRPVVRSADRPQESGPTQVYTETRRNP